MPIVRDRDSNLRRLRSNLRRAPEAMAALAAFGIEAGTMETWALGLREPYERTDGRVVEGVLSYALSAAAGRRRFGCVALPGVTFNAEHEVAWSPGRPGTLRWAAGRGTIVVCGSPVELWQLGQAAERAGMAVTVVASSQPGAAPGEWSDRRFWAGAERVVITASVSAAIRRVVLGRSPVPVDHVPGVGAPPAGAEAIADRHIEWLGKLLSEGVRCEPAGCFFREVAGDFAAEALPVHGGFAGGQLLHPFVVERRREEPGDAAGTRRMVYSMETLVLRGDGVVLEAEALPAPRGTPPERRVHALTDGTRIEGPPRAGLHGSWSLASIRSYIAARVTACDPCARPPAATLADLRAILEGRVSLPDPDDIDVAAAFVAMSFMFRIFDALPILLLVGPAGSGKSELAAAIAQLSCNGTVMGQGSPAALIRLVGESGGLVVLDDAEALAADAAGFGELAQCMKTSYKASTGKKAVVTGSGRVRVLDFFGPRVVTATREIDPILASRSIAIRTAPADRAALPRCDADPASVRDELHTLAMARAGDVAARYRELLPLVDGRDREIAAPLLAVARVLGGEAMDARLARRLGS